MLHKRSFHVAASIALASMHGGYAASLSLMHSMGLGQPLYFHDLSCKVEKSKIGLDKGKVSFNTALLHNYFLS